MTTRRKPKFVYEVKVYVGTQSHEPVKVLRVQASNRENAEAFARNYIITKMSVFATRE
jgi:hypothetical protein